MRLVTYDDAGSPRFGALANGKIIDLSAASEHYSLLNGSVLALPPRIEAFLEKSETLFSSAAALVASAERGEIEDRFLRNVSQVSLLPPITNPPKIICVARNYAEHAKEAGLEISPIPIIFARFANTLVADGAPVIVPTVSNNVDWEGELAVIIGKGTNGKRITKDEAMDYVFGYSIFNDVTVRDYQFRVTQYTAGKNFRSSGPFGPLIVTADEVPDPHNLRIETTLNGRTEQSASTSTMIYDIPTILEHIAEFIDLQPGDVIPTGTPAGVGFKRKPPVFLRGGDVISVEIPGIGKLTNPVVEETRA